jgi:hypothetical protein
LFSTTVATATTEIDITGLSIGKDDTLRLVYTFVGECTAIQTQIYPNELTTTTNYSSARLLVEALILAARPNKHHDLFWSK